MTSKDIITSLPEKVNPSAIEGLETAFHFEITLPDDSVSQYTLELKDNNLTAYEDFIGEPKCVVKAKEEDFVNLVSGKLNPMLAIMTGKVKISNQGEMLKYAKVFGFL